MTESIITKEKRRVRALNRNRERGVREKIVHHHVKYKEIHGADEVVLMTESDHRRLHNRLRREGRCKIPVEELSEISISARNRSEHWKQQRKVPSKKYQEKYMRRIDFYTPMAPHIRLNESITYNSNSGTVMIYSRFHSTNGYKVLEVHV